MSPSLVLLSPPWFHVGEHLLRAFNGTWAEVASPQPPHRSSPRTLQVQKRVSPTGSSAPNQAPGPMCGVHSESTAASGACPHLPGTHLIPPHMVQASVRTCHLCPPCPVRSHSRRAALREPTPSHQSASCGEPVGGRACRLPARQGAGASTPALASRAIAPLMWEAAGAQGSRDDARLLHRRVPPRSAAGSG